VTLPDWAKGSFYTATLHRPSNTDHRERLLSVLEALGSVDLPVHLMAHPRLQQRINDFDLSSLPRSLQIHDPLAYSTMLAAVASSEGLLTDSGGLQKEAFVLGVPCTTIRDETEWPETLDGEWNVLAGSRLEDLPQLVKRQPRGARGDPFGDGKAAERVVREVSARIS
jgi:UDP-N-acetylglucosamine 2-epimerase (non-hydrolysing)